VPFSLGFEQKLNPEIKSWLAFAEEKLIELAEIRRAYEGETELVAKNKEGASSSAQEASLGQPRLRPQNSGLAGGAGVIDQYGDCRAEDSDG
jgi:5-methyltetrahydropteroyltriglutamate--homocysteine methyltransferase